MTITQQQIIALAVEAGFDDIAPWLDADNVEQGQIDAANRWIERMTAFAALAYQRGVRDERDACAKARAGKPRELTPVGTGALLGEQQYCFDKGWKEGAAAVRAAIRARSDK